MPCTHMRSNSSDQSKVVIFVSTAYTFAVVFTFDSIQVVFYLRTVLGTKLAHHASTYLFVFTALLAISVHSCLFTCLTIGMPSATVASCQIST